ncbi:helix-turn-helix domain-containing protein [bacterium]|nr:helix-turn-helix domain-containing protein [bacterium]
MENRNETLVGDALLDTRALAKIVGMSANAVRVALCRGTFPLRPMRLGSRLRWRASAVREWMESAGGERAAGSSAGR